MLSNVDVHDISGIRIPAGDSLTLSAKTLTEGYSCDSGSISYSLSYSAQP